MTNKIKFTALALLFQASSAFAAVPGLINFQGRLLDANKLPRTGTFAMTFKICDSLAGACTTPCAVGNPCVWTEDQSLTVTNGVFAAQLGAVNPIDPNAFSAAARYLDITVAGETLSPRERLAAGAFSFKASAADALATPRAINGVNFDGSVAVTVPVNSADDTATAAAVYPLWTTAAGNTAAKVSTSKLSFVPNTGVLTAGGFSGPLIGNITGNVSGSAATLTTPRAINGVNFDGSAAITVPVNSADDTASASTVYPLWTTAAGNTAAKLSTSRLSFVPNTGILTAQGFAGPLTGNVTGNVSGSAGTVTGAAQAAITSVGTLTGLTLGGALAMGANNITMTGTLGAGGVGRLLKGWFTDLDVANTITGSVNGNAATTTKTDDLVTASPVYPLWTTAAGNTGDRLSTTKLSFVPNTGILTASGFVGNVTGNASGSAATLATPRAINGVNFDGSAAITVPVNSVDDNSNAATVYPLWTTAAGNTAAKLSTTKLSFVPNTGILTAAGFVGNLTGNASGSAGTAGTVTAAAQPNITSVGTLTGLTVTAAIAGSVTGNAGTTTKTDDLVTAAAVYPVWTTAAGNNADKLSTTKLSFVPNTGILTATGFAGPLTGNVTGNVSGSAGTAGTVTAAAQPSITSVGTLTGLTVTAAIAGSVTGSAGTVTAAAQPNITSVGTLTGLTMGGALAMGANNITMTGTLGLTASRLAKGWFTDLDVTNAITSAGLTSAGALSVTSSLANALTLDSGSSGAINIGTNANAKTITLGNGTGATSLVLNAGTGNIDIGANAVARILNFGTGAAVVQTINVGGTGANVIGIGNTQTLGSISLGGAMTTGSINIGGTGAQTGGINIGAGTGAQIIDIGGTGANTVGIGDNQAGGSVSIGGTMTSGTISIGGIGAQTGSITIGPGTGAQVINVGTGNTSSTIKLGSAGTAFSAAGACTIASVAMSNTATNRTCTGVPASTAVAVWCSGAAAMTTPNTTALYCRATGTANTIACNTTVANSVAMTWKCMWMQ